MTTSNDPKPMHRCSVCDVTRVLECGDVCNQCKHRGTTRTFTDPDAILLNLLLWKDEIMARKERWERGE